MKRYPARRDSGVAWIGMIPSHWMIERIKRILYERKENNSPIKTTEILSLTNTRGVILYSQKGNIGNKSKDNIEDYHLTYPDDLVVNSMNVVIGSAGVSKYFGAISPVYYALVSRGQANIRFCEYIFRLSTFEESIKGLGNGILDIRKRIPMIRLNDVLLPIPPLSEQDQIVRFLDWKVSEINRLISLRKKQIAALEELKKAVISQAVTKGLNPNAKMKDSGVSWIGEIPEGWELVKLNHIADKTRPYSIGDGDHGLVKPSDYVDSGIPYIRVQNLGWGADIDTSNIVYITNATNNKILSSTLRPNDVLFAKTGGTIGKTGIVPETMTIANTTSHVGKITVSQEYNPKYVFYVLSSSIGYTQFWQVAAQKTTRPELTIAEIKAVYITLPPNKVEQEQIVAYLDAQTAKINATIDKKKRQIKLLQELKTRLIADVVTGKIDVRGVEIPEYEYAEEEADAAVLAESEERKEEVQGDE